MNVQPEIIYPLTFKPILKDYIWGGNNLHNWGKNSPSAKIAESWEASCHPKGIGIISSGILKGKTLPEIIDAYGASIVGTNLEGKKYPLLIKFIDANEKLSVQVHPSDEYAAIENESGKNEMWYIVSAKPDAFIYYGLKGNITKDIFKDAIKNGTIEECLYKLQVKAGDAVYIPAGTVHAIGSGIVVIEVQQNSDATYRVFDYNRKDSDGKLRPLHIDKALDIIDFSNKRANKIQKGIRIKIGNKSYKTILAANKYFSSELLEFNDIIKMKSDPEKFFIYTLIDGLLTLSYQSSSITLKKGTTVLIPAQLGEYTLLGKFKAIKAYVPNLEEDIFKPLISIGFDRNYISECIQ